MMSVSHRLLIVASLLGGALSAHAAEPCHPAPSPTLCTAAVPAGGKAPQSCVLWHIVHDQCTGKHGPAPCAAASIKDGYAILKDRAGHLQFLLIPTEPVTGIEDPRLLAPGAPNYFAIAWGARDNLDKAWRAEFHVPADIGQNLAREEIALAVNSVCGRTQDQLHIHIDWLLPQVETILKQHLADIGAHFTPFPVELEHHQFRAMRLAKDDIGGLNPFQLLRDSGVPPAEMGQHTLVLIGATFDNKPGFILLDGKVDLPHSDRGSGELLQDHG